MFKKNNFETVIADIFSLGQFVKNTSLNQSEFIPCLLLQQEALLSKSPSIKLREPTQKLDINTEKVAQVCLISEQKVQHILRLFSRAIVSYKLALILLGLFYPRREDESRRRLKTPKQRAHLVHIRRNPFQWPNQRLRPLDFKLVPAKTLEGLNQEAQV